ncbi:hypothetical protein [Rhizobium tubonense]|uniref:hypothetical protein n=1 Tax=Rhizobium tubonense TaxID=484088 RepID=UPI000DA792BE
MVLDPHGDLCSCGTRGCLELRCSGATVLNVAEALGWGHLDGRFRRGGAGDIGFHACLKMPAKLPTVWRRLAPSSTRACSSLVVVWPPRAKCLAPMRSSHAKYTLVKPGDVEGSAPQFAIGRFLDDCMGAVGLILRHHGRLA